MNKKHLSGYVGRTICGKLTFEQIGERTRSRQVVRKRHLATCKLCLAATSQLPQNSRERLVARVAFRRGHLAGGQGTWNGATVTPYDERTKR